MPGPEHERVSRNLCIRIQIKVGSLPGHSIDSLEATGSTEFRGPGNEARQADEGLMPATRVGRFEWPSLLMEVGYSQSEIDLCRDARWWLTASRGKIRFVITAKVRRNPLNLSISCWQMLPGRYDLRNRLPLVFTLDQTFNIDLAGNVTSEMGCTSLRIPYLALFDQVPENPPGINQVPVVPADIELSLDELRQFALNRFRLLV